MGGYGPRLEPAAEGRAGTDFDGSCRPAIECLVKSLYAARSGESWIGTTRGLAVLRAGRIVQPGGSATGSPVVSIEGDRQGRVYAAIEGIGVSVFDENTMREIPSERIPIRNAVSLYADGGQLWIGTLGDGLILLDHGRMTAFQPKDGLFDDEIFGIASDGGGFSVDGLQQGDLLSPPHRVDRASRRVRYSHLVSIPYSPLEGLQTVECKSGVQPAVWHMKDGHVSFSTIRGLLVMDPSQAAWKIPPPRAVVEEVVVNGRTQPAAGHSRIFLPGRRTSISCTPGWISGRPDASPSDICSRDSIGNG